MANINDNNDNPAVAPFAKPAQNVSGRLIKDNV